jgi:hypothetical protein
MEKAWWTRRLFKVQDIKNGVLWLLAEATRIGGRSALFLREIDRAEQLISFHIAKSKASGRLGMLVVVLASIALFDCDANRAMT